MLRVAVCDDEKIIANQMEKCVLDICRRENIPVDTDVFYSGKSLEQEIYKGTYYDLIYMDIQMAKGDGITAAKNIRKIDENALLIYVSGYDKYLMELFRLDVFTFIKKPIDNLQFEKIFLDANRKINRQRLYFNYQYKKQEFKLLCMDILFFESTGRKIIIHVKEGGERVFNGKLSAVEEWSVNGKIPFLRIHQSYLVNYHHISARSKTEVKLTDGTKLPVSEERQKAFSNSYSRLLGSEIDV